MEQKPLRRPGEAVRGSWVREDGAQGTGQHRTGAFGTRRLSVPSREGCDSLWASDSVPGTPFHGLIFWSTPRSFALCGLCVLMFAIRNTNME